MVSVLAKINVLSFVYPALKHANTINKTTTRNLWGWLNSAFNKVDEDRRKLVGADRACAEWLLRCGAAVKWKDLNHWQKDYNTLPGSNFDKYRIEEIDASDSAVMGIGFPHLEGLKYVKSIILHNCGYLDDSALTYLPLVKDTLVNLQLSTCGDITNQGLQPIYELKSLRNLKMFDLPEVRNMPEVVNTLKTKLPHCNVEYIAEAKKSEK